jgi:amino acid adenylation domain-containing protein
VGPRTRLESALAHIWQEVLNTEDVGVENDFFRLGGESLLAAQMLTAVAEELHVQVDFVDFVESPTIASLAACVEQARQHPARVAEGPAEGSPEDGPCPCTFAQERLWFSEELTGRKGVYNLPVGVRLRGAVDPVALERSLQELVRRHAALRTAFRVDDGLPVQVIAPEAVLPLELHDLRGRSESTPEEAAQRLVDELACQPFDLARAPLARAQLLRLGDDDYVLQLVFHHTVSDGWSLVVVLRELGPLYEAFLRDEQPALPAPRVQYPDYACEQRRLLQGSLLDEKLEPWRQRLAEAPPALELPTDRPRPPIPSYRGTTRRSRLPAETTARLRSLSRAEGVTPYVILVTAFDIVLARYSGQETIVVGATTSGRRRPELEDSVGLYSTTVVLVSDLSGQPTFRKLVHRVRDVVLDALAHDDAPFQRLVADLEPERDLSRHPLFQVFVEQVPHASLQLESVEVSPFHANASTSQFDLTLFVEQGADDELELVWEYCTDLFQAATVEQIERHFLHVLDVGLTDPGREIAALPLLSEAEREQLLRLGRGEDVDYASVCLHELVEAQCKRTPDATAVSSEEGDLTYRELNARADRLAHHLRRQGVGAGTLVGICLERSPEMVVGLLGVLKTGGAYVPLDPSYPPDRLRFMLEDSAVPVLLTQERLLDRLAANGIDVLCLDRDWDRLVDQDETEPGGSVTPDDLAYVIYTSGSTGKPKGAMNTHRGIVNRLLWMQQAYRLDETDRILQKTPIGFDVSVWEFFWPLMTGARLIVARPGGHQDPEYLITTIESEGVTTMHFVPSMLHLFLSARGVKRCRSLRRVICSGEALSADLVDRFFEHLDCELHNLYGPTEAAVDVTAWQCSPGDARSTVPIGRPIANTQMYVLDPAFEPTPLGVPGELWIGGVQVARGYVNRPELTAERFPPNPFAPGRLYRTGDLARWSSDGVLEFLGRVDDQIKLRGVRIEPGEIEAVLNEYEAVYDSAVVAINVGAGDARLVAYVVPEPGQAATVRRKVRPSRLSADLRSFLAGKLPDAMVPGTFVFLDELPLSPNGKLDRKALPEPSWEERSERLYAAPRTETEEQLAAIWRQTLGVARVGVDDNFFHLGGHSLLAARVVTKAREQLGLGVSLRTLFEHPTLGAFAEHVTAAQSRRETESAPVEPLPREWTSYPLGLAQQQLLFLHELEPAVPTYNDGLAIRIEGPLDVDALAWAVAKLIERQEALRTVVAWRAGTPAQIVLEEWRHELPLVDLTDRPEDARDAELARLLRERARLPFALGHDLMLRTTLFRLGNEDHVVLLNLHHLAADGWSFEVLFQELSELYEARVGGRAPQLAELPLQFRDFALWQRERLNGDFLADEIGYWRSKLAGAPTLLNLPTDRPRPLRQTFEGSSYYFCLSGEVRREVLRLSRELDVTSYMLLLAVFGTLLYRVTSQNDILVGSPFANRGRGEFQPLVGFFANTLALRIRLAGNPPFTTLLEQVRDTVLGAYEHQELPFVQVVEALRAPRHAGMNPLVQVNFRLHVGEPPCLELTGTRTSRVPFDIGLARFDLALELHVREDDIAAEFIYNTDLFECSSIEQLARIFEGLLKEILADPEQRLLSLKLEDEDPALAPTAAGGEAIRRFRERGVTAAAES